MAKKIVGFIKLQVPAGKANPSPPIGPALGQRGLNIMEFCKAFNAKTQGLEPGLPIPVVITAFADKSFTFIMKTPPATILIKKAAAVQKGSATPNSAKVGTLTRAQAEEIAKTKFDESIDVAVQLGIDPKKSDQLVRGSVVLPAGTGKSVRVAVFAQGEKAEAAKAAGADIVGLDDLAASIKAGNIDFDVVIASPDTMRVVGALGQVLGPRGLMPNPKVGTVTPDVVTAVKNAKAGQVQYRTDKAGIIHATIGRASFDVEKLQVNLAALIDALNKARPAAAKGIYLRKVAVSSTMGGGARVELASLAA